MKCNHNNITFTLVKDSSTTNFSSLPTPLCSAPCVTDVMTMYLNLVTGQMFLMDRFFEGAFFTFGLEVIAFAERDQEDRLDPMVYIFPRMTKCTFHKFGTSGNIEKHDALCILPLNIVNEKIYIFIWFWLLLLGKLINYVKRSRENH